MNIYTFFVLNMKIDEIVSMESDYMPVSLEFGVWSVELKDLPLEEGDSAYIISGER